MARGLVVEEKPLPDFLYARLLGLVHRYAIVGGMPGAVATFLETNNIDAVRSVHANIHALYRADIAKYAPVGLRPVIRDIYDLIPSEAGSKKRRFKLSSIEGVKRFEQVADHVLWLTNAGFAVNMGAAYEGFVAQELKAHGFRLRHFTSKKVGKFDFRAEQRDGDLLALEVKSGSSYLTHAALDNALEVAEYTIDEAVVLAEANARRRGRILYLPIFMVGTIGFEG